MSTNVAVINSWAEMFDQDDVIYIEKKFTVHEDPIALSCVMYRLRTTNDTIDDRPSYIFNLQADAKTLAKSITSEDRLLAQTIRSFYNGKLVVSRLRNQPLTKFRQDLATLLLMNVDEYGLYSIPEKFSGMLYKLPYFYEYDRNLIDDVFGSEYCSVDGPRNLEFANLNFIRKLDAYRKRKSVYEYWFTDDRNNRVVLYMEKSNPALQLFEKHINENNIFVRGLFVIRHLDNLSFYTPNNVWQLEI